LRQVAQKYEPGTDQYFSPTEGQPNADRTWTECFAQLVGTVLSLWDAAELDAAGENGEVLPKFLNLTDASIKMVIIVDLSLSWDLILTPPFFADRGAADSLQR
jgi:hypothetical protein